MDKTTYFYPNLTLRAGGRIVDFRTTAIMGILNVTPDSFFDGGQYNHLDAALQQALRMQAEGADILDIGGMSTRPGAKEVPVEEELNRVIPVITAIHKVMPEMLLSIDTVHAIVAQQALEAGASIINDVSAGAYDPEILQVAARNQAPYILMHMQGKPDDMQKNPVYTDVTAEVIQFFIQKVRQLRDLGIHDILLDPGFGFGKTLDHNYTLLRDWEQLQNIGLPLLAGVSRKSMVCRLLDIPPLEALNGTTALHSLLMHKGVQMIRVHDVREAVQVRTIIQAAQKGAVV